MSDFRKRVFDFVMDALDAGYPPTCPIGASPERDPSDDAPTIGDVRALLTTSDGSLPWVFIERTPAYWSVTLERFRDKLTATAAPHLPDGLAVGEVMRTIKPEIAELLERAETAEAEVSRLRADGAALKVRADEAFGAHCASFGALQTLSAALFDGEVDDYAALVEKVIARVTQAEADWAVLRERVKQHAPLIPECDFGGTPTGLHCAWCAESWDTSNPADHPDNGCLWSEVHKPARAPKEPTQDGGRP